MNTLELRFNDYTYTVDGKTYPEPHQQCDFVVDGQSLGELFRFEEGRPWFGQTCFDYPDPHRAEMILQLRGLKPATNQFETNRFVLYRCHCGDDNCGIISCEIDRANSVVRWTDVRYEADLDQDDEPMFDGMIPLLEFDADAYDSTIAGFTANGT